MSALFLITKARERCGASKAGLMRAGGYEVLGSSMARTAPHGRQHTIKHKKKVKGGEPMINLVSQGCAVRDESGRVLCPSHPTIRYASVKIRGHAASGAVVRNVNVPLQNHGRHLRCQFRDMEFGKATNKGLLSSLTLTTLRLKGPM
jgi:hypothetical protein